MKRLLALCFLLPTLLLANAEKPNFVIIFIDDMGYGDIGPFGSTANRTPHLNQMAKEGLKLTSFYAAPVCSASRAQLLTGSYAPRVSVPGVFFPAGPKGLHPQEHTIADYLKELGYATACVGKWHLGDQPEFLPTRQGFDSYFGIPYSNDMQRVSSESGLRVHPLLRNEEVAELLEDEDQRRITREYTEEAIQFIEATQDDPFFLYFPHTAMHVPLFPHPDFVGKSENGTYGDWVEEVDWSVGQVLDTLKRLNLEESTLVVFTSDNGPWASKGKNGGVSGPLRGSKGGTLEGGVREPTLVRWPGTIAANQSLDAISGTTDILPTLVSLAGGTLREDITVDGVDLSPLLLGETTESPRDTWHYYKGTNITAIRQGPWKLALKPQSIGMGFNEQPEDLRSQEPRLYHLEEEIGEQTNRATEHPDLVERLTQLALAHESELKASQRPPGQVENPVTLYPTVPRPPKNASKKGKPIDWETAKMGDVFATHRIPSIKGKALTIRCTLDNEKAHGVLLAHGGSSVGYALYVKEESIVFAVRPTKGQMERLSLPLTSGPIMATLSSQGFMTLQLGDQKAEGATMVAIHRHPAEDLSLGLDEANPVDPEAPSGTFQGQASGFSLEIE